MKRLALIWAQAHDFRIAATEVRLPRSSFRADVAACSATPGMPTAAGSETALFECKQARSDLLRDTAPERETADRLRAIGLRRHELETLLGLHLPSLRRGESLFAECDAYDLASIRHDGWRALCREEAMLKARLFGATKFARIRRYRCAHRLYLVVEPGVLEPHETPEGWGLLVRDGVALRLERRPERTEPAADAVMALFQSIALAGTRAVNRHEAITVQEVEEARRLGPSV